MSKAASYSRYGLYKKCPASFEWQYILGHKQEYSPGPAAIRGTRVHKSIEDFFLADSGLDDEIPLEVGLHICKHDPNKCTITPELEFALTKEWEPTTFEAEDAYVRGYIDGVFL